MEVAQNFSLSMKNEFSGHIFGDYLSIYHLSIYL